MRECFCARVQATAYCGDATAIWVVKLTSCAKFLNNSSLGIRADEGRGTGCSYIVVPTVVRTSGLRARFARQATSASRNNTPRNPHNHLRQFLGALDRVLVRHVLVQVMANAAPGSNEHHAHLCHLHHHLRVMPGPARHCVATDCSAHGLPNPPDGLDLVHRLPLDAHAARAPGALGRDRQAPHSALMSTLMCTHAAITLVLPPASSTWPTVSTNLPPLRHHHRHGRCQRVAPRAHQHRPCVPLPPV